MDVVGPIGDIRRLGAEGRGDDQPVAHLQALGRQHHRAHAVEGGLLQVVLAP
jgi:hypothetical protein